MRQSIPSSRFIEPTRPRLPKSGFRVASFAVLALASCVAEVAEEPAEELQLSGLRVLAIQSEPADLLPGESALLRSLVYVPDNAEIEYEWSWCPVRAGAEESFGCALEEEELEEMWASFDLGVELPPYDLGTTAEVEFRNVFVKEIIDGLCAGLLGEEDVPELALRSCAEGFEVSVRLDVRAGKVRRSALKSLTLRDADTPDEQRNHNPGPFSDVVLKEHPSDRKASEALTLGKRYTIELDLDDELSETFSPEEETEEEAQETLVLSWFSTPGSIGSFSDEDGLGDDFAVGRSVYIPGESDFSKFRQNGWDLSVGESSDEAALIAVLRDDRGGVSWFEQRFELEEDK